MSKQTPSQTVGPYLRIGLMRAPQNILVSDATEGERIRIEGRVLDGEDRPVSDALVEIWQANTHGKYDHPEDFQDKPLDPAFKGFGRAPTDGDGLFWFETIKPGPVPGPGNTLQAPHINVTVFARGMLLHLNTRIYFPEDPANEHDPVLDLVEDPERRRTLISDIAEGTLGELPVYRFDIVLQGADETVFFQT